jgi:iron complex outermembrane receptor protein
MAHMFRLVDVLIAPLKPDTTAGRAIAATAVRRFETLVVSLALSLLPAIAHAQGSGTAQPGSSQDDPEIRFRVPTITVTAQKEPEDQQKVPASITAVSQDTIESAGIRIVNDAALYAPNTYFTEWSARKLSTARFRGISSSPNNPGVTTYVDGVPQLNANSSSIELVDVGQIEFVRGPQSALYGRNTLGGLVNITSARPSMSTWHGALSVPFGNYGSWGIRGSVAGPVIADKLSVGVSVTEMDRNGFTENTVTGHDIDARSAFSGKAQLLWKPTSAWESRVIVSGERARDGDYALHDVAALRATPFAAARDFEGRIDRDVTGTTVLLRRPAGPISFSSTTGLLDWKTRDVTDLDYTPLPALTRDNTEDAFQFTQEIRFASAEGAPIALTDRARLRWQSGLFLFTQDYKQDAITEYAPFVIIERPVTQHSPRAALDDVGLGLFGQATVTLDERLDLAAGARFDYEDKSATLETFSDPPIGFPTRLDTEKSFSNVSPQVSAAYRLQTDKTIYATAGRGYKAGGFNPASPAGREAYGEEFTWNIEGGVKSLWADGRVSANAAVFYIDWDDLQLNVPDRTVPAQFYIANVGGAVSKGVELEIGARAAPGVDLFTAVGYTHARFAEGSISSGANVDGNKIPNTPDYTVSAGAQYSRAVGPATLQARADAVFYGAFQYTDLNSLGQDAYSLVNLRIGVAGRFLTGELLIRNAFDTRYIPLAFPYPNLAPSGFIGEMGAPRTVSVAAGIRF